MQHLRELASILQSSIDALTGDDVEVAEGPLPATIVRELEGLSQVQKEAVLATIMAMKSK